MMSIKSRLRTIRDEVYRIGDEIGILQPDHIYNDDWFKRMAENQQLCKDADQIVDQLVREFEPDSVIDLGCGVGHYLNSFADRGTQIHGVEGSSNAFPHLQVPNDSVEIHDLRNPYSPPKEFDLVVCFEVAEHLPERAADTLVDSVVQCSDQVAFTAATPRQDGNHHINLQPHRYWINKFKQRGYRYCDSQSQRIRDEINVEKTVWIQKNLMLFSEQ